MKVAIGYRLQDGPWGGGNQFAISLMRALQNLGHEVFFDLNEPDIDVVVLTDPRAASPSVSFGAGKIFRYLLKYPHTIIIHRINECDERKSTHHMNMLLRFANYVSDHTVFIASWLKDLNVWRREGEASIILNGADRDLFQNSLSAIWNGVEPLRLVTHHWGGNNHKGFDVYKKIDDLLDGPIWKNRIEMTYIGNLPKDCLFRNVRCIRPLAGRNLAAELASHHVYITASINEPAGMHHIEGALTGLPVLYRNSGALPEYCEGFGLEFQGDNFVPALEEMFEKYYEFKQLMISYPYTSEKMTSSYINLFEDLLGRRDLIVNQRKLWRAPLMAIVCLIFL